MFHILYSLWLIIALVLALNLINFHELLKHVREKEE